MLLTSPVCQPSFSGGIEVPLFSPASCSSDTLQLKFVVSEIRVVYMTVYSRSSVGSHTYDFSWLQCSYTLNVSVKMRWLFLFPTFSCFCAKRFPVHTELLRLWESELTAWRGTVIEVKMTWHFKALFTVLLLRNWAPHGMVECSDAASSSYLLKRK